MGWLDNWTFDKEEFRKTHNIWSRAARQNEHDEEAQQKFRILDYIEDALLDKGKSELTAEELRRVLTFVDDIEGPLLLEQKEIKAKEAMEKKSGQRTRGTQMGMGMGSKNVQGATEHSGLAKAMEGVQLQGDKQATEPNAGEQDKRHPPNRKERKRQKRLENERRKLENEPRGYEARAERRFRDPEYRKAYEIERAKVQVEFDRQVRLMAEREAAEKAAKAEEAGKTQEAATVEDTAKAEEVEKAVEESAMEIDS